MNTSTLELFSNFKGTLNDYTATAFGIGTFMSACKTALDDETREQYKQNIRKNIKEEIELEKALEEYVAALVVEYNVFSEILNAIESLRKTSYDAGKAYYLKDKCFDYNRLQSVFNEDHNALLKMMEEELEYV